MKELDYEAWLKNLLSSKWYVQPCFSGESCWCRAITTDINDDSNDTCVVPDGSIKKAIAEHIVELHNKSLEK